MKLKYQNKIPKPEMDGSENAQTIPFWSNSRLQYTRIACNIKGVVGH